MSNVILGIIGLALFIGLALAGATYLGAGITDAKIQSGSVITIQSGQQAATAATLYRMRQRTSIPVGSTSMSALVSAGILKTMPTNPVSPGNAPIAVGPTGTTQGKPTFITMSLGQTSYARDVCIEIEASSGHTDRIDGSGRVPESTMQTAIDGVLHAQATPGKPACARLGQGQGTGGAVAGDYVAFFPI